jgi:PAS domain S-box-containing protein
MLYYYESSQSIFKRHVIRDVKREFYELNYTFSDYLYSGKIQSFLPKMDEVKNVNQYLQEINVLDSEKTVILSTTRNRLNHKCDSDLIDINDISMENLFSNVKYFMPVAYEHEGKVDVYYITGQMEKDYFREEVIYYTHHSLLYVFIGGVIVFLVIILLEYKLIIVPIKNITGFIEGTEDDMHGFSLKEFEHVRNSIQNSIEEHQDKNRFIRNVLDAQKDIVLVTTGSTLIDTNTCFFDFFPQYKDVAAFVESGLCICDYFEDAEGGDFLTAEDKEDGKWVTKIIKNEGVDYKVKMMKGGDEHIFCVKGTEIDSEKPLYVVSFIDITLLESYQHKLEKMVEAEVLKRTDSEKRYEYLFNSMAEGFCIHYFDDENLPTEFIEVNDRMVEMFGYSREELMKLKPINLHTKDITEELTATANLIHEQGYLDFEADLLRKDGTVFIAELHSKVIDYQGKRMVFTSIRDVTDRKQLESENILKEQIITQQAKLSAMGEMIRSITHQWKQPLNVMSLISGLMEECIEDTMKGKVGCIEDLQDYIWKMGEQVEFLSDTIDDFSNFFKPASDIGLYSPSAVITKLFKMMEYQYSSAGLAMHIEIKSEEDIAGSPNDLKQIFLNLFNNSKDAYLERRHMKEYESVVNGDIQVSIDVEGDMLVITYRDKCGGVPESVMAKMFQPYNTTKRSTGTGIGMYMCGQMVNKMGGDINISNIENGIEVVVRMPKA